MTLVKTHRYYPGSALVHLLEIAISPHCKVQYHLAVELVGLLHH